MYIMKDGELYHCDNGRIYRANSDELMHFGVKGMKWGVRKQNSQLNRQARGYTRQLNKLDRKRMKYTSNTIAYDADRAYYKSKNKTKKYETFDKKYKDSKSKMKQTESDLKKMYDSIDRNKFDVDTKYSMVGSGPGSRTRMRQVLAYELSGPIPGRTIYNNVRVNKEHQYLGDKYKVKHPDDGQTYTLNSATNIRRKSKVRRKK